ncbi:hypothetical protein OPT61_g4273 [Boeremia exigua]|uniref:Uncharacterized protein n=1 Tax=Boeremia exigua TaxID=749465 RepID=A0ACC2IEQ8_9PLEO|nr:hypothetical protein OPT61_g4273 [Boeremia exigua]
MYMPAKQSNDGSQNSLLEGIQLHDIRLAPGDPYIPNEATRHDLGGQMYQDNDSYVGQDGANDHNALLEDGNGANSTVDNHESSGNKTDLQDSSTPRGQFFKNSLALLRKPQRRLSHHAKHSRFHGWRMGVLFGCCTTRDRDDGYESEDGLVTLFYGDEAAITRFNTGIHVLINVFSSLLLAGSNYTMQVISSPTREEIDKAHRQQDWFAIGLLSPRNWKRIARRRALMCLILGLSSVPLHLFYNATVFKVAVRNYYPSSAIDMRSSNYTDLATNTSYIKLTNSEWKSAFAGSYTAEYSELILVCDEFELTPMLNSSVIEPQGKFLADMDFNRTYGIRFNVASETSETNWITWEDFNRWNTRVALHVAHAFAAPAQARSRVQLSLYFMIVVISVNVFKLFIMLSVLVTDRSSYIVTLGDAAASFLSNPDPVTEGKCLLEDEKLIHDNNITVEKQHKSPQNGQNPDLLTTRGWQSRTLSYFALIRNEQARCTVLAVISFMVVLVVYVSTTTAKKPWSWGTSSDGALSLGNGSSSAAATIRNAFLANLPQLLLSFCYMNLNSFCTAMAGAKEWNNFSRTRKAFRVSKPTGKQRNTYFLQLPYRYSVPLIIFGTALHWILSQTFFLVRTDVFAVNGTLDTQSSRSACGVSSLSFLVLFVLFIGLCVTVRQLASRNIVTGLPQAASNSLIISAGCHPASDEIDPHLKAVQWGVISGQIVDGFEHCSLSSRPVTTPEEALPPAVMADAHEQPLCAMCDKASIQLCGGCKPDEQHYSMIYFPIDEPKPRLIWMRIEPGHNHPMREELTKHGIVIDCSESEGRLRVKTLDENIVLQRPLSPRFIQFVPPSAAQCCPCCRDKHKVNASLLEVDPEIAETLRGPIIAWSMHLEDLAAHKSSLVDFDPMDFRHMVDGLRLHYEEAVESYSTLGLENPKIKRINGVRLNCKGDQLILDRPHLEMYTVPMSTLREQSLLCTPVADRLGMSLHVAKVAPAPIWRDRELKARMHNCCSGYLNPFIAMPDDIGSLVITRKDGKDLGPHLLQSFFEFTANKLEYDGAKPPFPNSRLNRFTQEDTQRWIETMPIINAFEIFPDYVLADTVRASGDEPIQDQEMEDI